MPTSAVIRTLGILALGAIPVGTAVAQAAADVADRDTFVAWATRAAMPLAPLDGPDTAGGTPALSSLSTFTRATRVIALGESVHDAHEFIVLRTRLTEQLIRRGRVAVVVSAKPPRAATDATIIFRRLIAAPSCEIPGR